jgi:acyl-coenzyme A synthetase/AMP-(fatty) acid ligase
LYTSGTTGAPKEVRRKLRNMEAELNVLHSLWVETLGPCRFYSTVSHRHIYVCILRLRVSGATARCASQWECPGDEPGIT